MSKWLLVIAATWSTTVLAQARVDGNIELGGLGCQATNTSVAISPDGRVLSVLFDDFIVEAGVNSGRDFQMKNCVLRIPISIAPGHRVAIESAQYRGAMDLPDKPAWSDLIIHYGWLMNYGTPQLKSQFFYDSKIWQGPVSEEYTHDVVIRVRDPQNGNTLGPVWSECGQKSLHFELGAKLRLNLKNASGDALGTVDSVDADLGQKGLKFFLKTEPCRAPNPPSPPPRPPRRR